MNKMRYASSLLVAVYLTFAGVGVDSASSASSAENGSQGNKAESIAPLFEKRVVFQSGTEGYHTYRIPGLVVSRSGVLLLFCDGRANGAGDLGKMDLVMNRSLNGGQTWEKMQVLYTDPDPQAKIGNVSAVADLRTGDVHAIFCKDLTRAFCLTTKDDGATFQKPVEITDTFKKFSYDWKFFAAGHAHGIQLKNGRLTVPVFMSEMLRTAKGGPTRFRAGVIYSDDQGKHWQAGGLLDDHHPNESTIYECANGELAMNSRANKVGYRMTARSSDGGLSWTKPVVDQNLSDPTCQASTVVTKTRDGKSVLLFSNPSQGGRKNLAVRLSYDDGQTWPVMRVVDTGPTAYSELAVLPDGTISLVYEGGKKTSSETLTFVRFNLEWLLQNDHAKKEAKHSSTVWPDVADSIENKPFDLIVWEATPAGIAMSVRAAREGLSVLLANHTQHVGGILSSGLGVWDTQYEGKRAPLYDEVRQSFFDHYRLTYGQDSTQYRDALPGKSGHTNGRVEPRVAERIFSKLIAQEKNITVLAGYFPANVEQEGRFLRAVSFQAMSGNRTVRATAPAFADCSYEGDLAAVAKIPFRVGRESREEHNEPHAGVVFMKGATKAPNAASERIAKLHDQLALRKFSGFQEVLSSSTGKADGNVQAFNYRTILSSDPNNQLATEKPASYDREFLKSLEYGSIVSPLPNQKIGWNRPQLVGPHNDYVQSNWAARQRVMDQHWQATLGLLWFLQNDESVPADKRAYWKKYGLAKDEFPDNHHRPYEIYVREARRIVGRYTFTEHDATLAPPLERAPVHGDSIGVTEWYLDTHACTKNRSGGSLDEGKMMLHHETFPGQVPYRALLPQKVDNLLVPVCLSATHVAWGTVRLEPTWMNIAESAALAVVQASAKKQSLAEIDTNALQRTLVKRHVMISFFNDVNVSSDQPWVAAAQYLGTKGFFETYNVEPNKPLEMKVAELWAKSFALLYHKKELDGTQLARLLASASDRSRKLVTADEFVRLLITGIGANAKEETRARKMLEGFGVAAQDELSRGDACRLMFLWLSEQA